jgi:hypothetical protein
MSMAKKNEIEGEMRMNDEDADLYLGRLLDWFKFEIGKGRLRPEKAQKFAEDVIAVAGASEVVKV